VRSVVYKIVEKTKTHVVTFSETPAIKETTWKNIVGPNRPSVTIKADQERCEFHAR